ncbi:hypothetical protein K144313037_p20410 (plasmid) [Clostridium tetani]|uniref:Uncharacterized protein n=1 Tax=Clostridium tetani TaxID=1513 RepID=A0ABC8EBZ9_CLOTA|nr:hypothetical protein [Clostridium tetani]YP_009216654.1 hypothetical protein phiCT453A_10 [Clostridium phage phiCT453A]YP_009219376.1 hypothetical protein phiCT9441A_10 [Clostridium phage phiCT9441A]YP_009277216.1 hypothetical protein phiCTC2A_09 [Clostridium phage phiCTC2A]YP_009277283.1 hypothetical protein phiCT19406A_09 [Clostridium phage phiCT19406A]AJA42500.1 hypothetical protein phiCT453A_10 [Clostridium phage phiCT453A]AJA42623.1 hypothetical protein phiCT9441A_10 [Clostridium phag
MAAIVRIIEPDISDEENERNLQEVIEVLERIADSISISKSTKDE